MVHNLADTTCSGKKWWLLKYGRLVQIVGALLIILLPLIFLFFVIENPFSLDYELLFNFIFLLILSFFVIIWMIYSGSAYSNLYSVVKELGPEWVIEDFDPLRCKITAREGGRQYMILYHAQMTPFTFWVDGASLILSWDRLPEHYQVWTQYGRGSVPHDRYDLAKHVRASGVSRFLFRGLASSDQQGTIFDKNLMDTVPRLHKEAKQISSLRFVGFAREGVEIVLAAFLVQHGGKEVIQVLDLLKKITQGTKEYHPFDDEWKTDNF